MFKLVSDWREAWRWNSMHILGIIALLPLVWDQIPPEIIALIPYTWQPYIITVLALSGIVARIHKQKAPGNIKNKEDEHEY